MNKAHSPDFTVEYEKDQKNRLEVSNATTM